MHERETGRPNPQGMCLLSLSSLFLFCFVSSSFFFFFSFFFRSNAKGSVRERVGETGRHGDYICYQGWGRLRRDLQEQGMKLQLIPFSSPLSFNKYICIFFFYIFPTWKTVRLPSLSYLICKYVIPVWIRFSTKLILLVIFKL